MISRLVEVPSDDDGFSPVFGPMGPDDALDHVVDFGPWLRASNDTAVAVSAASAQLPGLAQPTLSGSLAIVRVAPAGTLPVGTIISLTVSMLSAQQRVRSITTLITVMSSA